MYVDVFSPEHERAVAFALRNNDIRAIRSRIDDISAVASPSGLEPKTNPKLQAELDSLRVRLAEEQVEHVRLTRLGR